MNLQDAIDKAVRSYFEGLGPDQFYKASGKRQKYNKKYFDRIGNANGIEPIGVDTLGIKTKAKS